MKNKILAILSFTATLALTVSSCQKENTTATSFTATMEQCQEQDGKTVFTNGTMRWEAGDQIKVFGTAGSGIYQTATGGSTTFNLVSGNAGDGSYHAFYPAAMTHADDLIELPTVQMSTDGSLTGFPMVAYSDNNSLDFKNLCGILRLRLQKNGVSVSAIEIDANVEVSGQFRVNYRYVDPTLSYEGLGYKLVIKTCSTPQNITNQKDFYLFLPEYEYENLTIRIYSSDGSVCTKKLNANQSISIHRSRITTITMSTSLTFYPNAGALSGIFTIDDEVHQVRFSQGNLQYTTCGIHMGEEGNSMPGTWRFSSKQYDYIGTGGNHNISDSFLGWIDLFGWGTGTRPTYYLRDNSYNTFVDWGTNSISNGGNQPNQWRTLTDSEWSFILRDRADASLKCGAGNINGVNGLIILPDNWTLPTGCSFNSGFNEGRGDTGYGTYTRNTYTLEQWAQMENAGAVFLPAAGYRWERGLNIGYFGFYWTSTRTDYINSWALRVNFFGYGLDNGGSPADGSSVRLVQNIN